MYEKIYQFKFHNCFAIVERNDRFYIERSYPENPEPSYFDPANDFKNMNPSNMRYITKPTRVTIKEGVEKYLPSLYEQIFGQKPQHDENEGEDETMAANNMDKMIEQFATVTQKAIQEAMFKNPYEEAIIEAIIQKGQQINEETIMEGLRPKLDQFIRETYGTLPKRIEIVGESRRKEISGIFHEKFEKILKIVERDVPLLLTGPAGSGKNHTLEQVAESLDLDFYFTNAVTQEYKLTGFIDANGHFHETQFFKAFTDGGLFFLDEMDASIPEVLIILNAAIANRYFDFPTGRYEAHPDFRVVAAANTLGLGSDNLYVGRNQLDAATLDRFVVIEFTYDKEVESQLASSKELYDFIVAARNAIDHYKYQYVVSMRATINASKLEGILDTEDILESVIFKGMPKDERRMLSMSIELDNNVYASTLRGMI